MMIDKSNRKVITRRVGVFVLLAGTCLPLLVSGKEPAKPRPLSEKELKEAFEFSFNDISDWIVTISSARGSARSAGSGFIAIQDGKPYLFTNQHILLGMDKVSFRTATGRTLSPKSVELSVSRDVARLPLEDETGGFELAENLAKGTPIAVFGNSDGAGVATELYGEIISVNDETIEVSAGFVSGNSGSPVLNADQEIVGIASYVRYTDDELGGSKTRRFCYQVAGDHCKSVNWKSFNTKHGGKFRENEQFVESVVALYERWAEYPYVRMTADNYSDHRLRNWANRHNDVIDQLMKLSELGLATQRKLDLTNDQIKEGMKARARVLILLCDTSARQMRKLAQQRGLTGYLSNAYKQLADRLDFAARDIERTGEYLSNRDYFHFK